MATTENSYTTSNATTTDFAFTFPYMKEADVNIDVAGTKQATTAYSFHNATTIRLNTAPASGVAVKVYRTTDDSGLTSTFYPGSAIRSGDLNDNFTQNLYSTQESINESTLATTTAEGAVTTANAATATANTASTNATAAVATANTASTNASAAVTTANTASTNASAAVTTANTANTTAASAVTTANAATTTANGAVTTANSANTKSDAAVATANSASNNASTAVATANTASTNASSAVTTANTASTNASSAVTTANAATTTANSATSTANSAVTTANAASTAVADAVLYTTVANKAALEAINPTENGYYEVTDSTGLANGTWTDDVDNTITYTLSGIPGTYPNTQLSGITTKFQYTHSSKTHAYKSYFANDGDDRYMVGPASDGSNGQYLQTNGSGVKSWATVDTSTLAPLASPTFTGTVAIPNIANVETAITGKAPLASPTFTGTVAIPNIANVETAITGKADLTGANFTGDVDIAQGDKLTLGSSYEIYESSGSSELRIKSLAGHMRHQLPASHSVLIEGPTDEIAKFTEGGSCELYYDDVKKFETTSTGVTVTGDITAVDLTLSGDLTVNGTMTTVDTDNLVVKDSLIYLARENTVNTLDIGIYGKYIDNTAPEYTGLFRDQTDSKWKLFDSLEVIPTTTVDTSGTGYAAATLVVGTLEDSKGDVRKIPENAKTTNYTLLIGDAGKHIKFTPGDANQTLTVPDSVFSEGDAVTIVNNSTNNLAIAKGTNMYYAADASNANRTLAGRGMATLLFTAADTCYISGAGLS